jgi:transposase
MVSLSNVPYRPPHSDEFRREAVELVRSSGKTIREVAHDLGCSSESLRIWVKQTRIDAGEEPGVTSDERSELRELRRQVRVLEQEREIL